MGNWILQNVHHVAHYTSWSFIIVVVALMAAMMRESVLAVIEGNQE